MIYFSNLINYATSSMCDQFPCHFTLKRQVYECYYNGWVTFGDLYFETPVTHSLGLS